MKQPNQLSQTSHMENKLEDLETSGLSFKELKDFPGDLVVKNPLANQWTGHEFHPYLGKIPHAVGQLSLWHCHYML